jgi:hypothetical protein
MRTLTYATAKNSLNVNIRHSYFMHIEGRNIAAMDMGVNHKSKNRFPKYGGQKGVVLIKDISIINDRILIAF